MGEILPSGYQKRHGGLVVAVLFGGFGGFLCYMAWKADADAMVVLPFAIILCVLVLGAILSDVTSNLKAGRRMAHRLEMMKYTHARGEILEQQLFFCVGDREFPKAPTEELHLRPKNKGYRFRVLFEDPRSGQKREAISELYSWFSLYEYRRVDGKMEQIARFREKEADVYVDLEGNAWVELLPAR